MRRRADVTIQILALLVFFVSLLPLFAQAPKPPSLKEQLEEQYQQPGTVLTIKQAGILGVPATSKTPCVTKYHGGKLTPDASCTASKPLTVGEKVNLLKIEVDEAKGKISFRIGECDACNKVGFSSRTSQIDFQFAKDASVSAVEGSIDEVLTIDEGEAQQAQPAKDLPAAPEKSGEASSDALTNSDVIKMARAKLGDGIILSKIKASVCNFDTSVDALVKLKDAGVSDPVIQAMHDAQEATKAADNATPPDEHTTAGNPPAGNYVAALHDSKPALVFAADQDRTFAVDLVDHDGERALRLRVHHSHMSPCTGYMYISHNRISYDPVDTPKFQKDAFVLQRSEIKKAAIAREALTQQYLVAIWTEKKRYLFYALFDPGAGSKSGVHQTLQDTVRAEAVYEFIGRSLNDFDSVLHEAETQTASLTRRP